MRQLTKVADVERVQGQMVARVSRRHKECRNQSARVGGYPYPRNTAVEWRQLTRPLDMMPVRNPRTRR